MSPCPTDEVLAAYVDQTAADPDSIEEHLDGCQECRVIVAHLGALGALHATAQQTLPAEEVTTATSPHAAAPLFGPPLPRGTRVDRYVVHHELGRGGMGVVLSAHDPQLDRTVALKIVRPGSRDASARARLLREARAMARLSHPNVVAIHDVGELDDGIFLAMEYVRGTTLRRVLAMERPFGRTMDLFLQAGRGLAAAHAAGIIHRDFKPDNVLVGTDHRVRVTDFGLARGTSSADVGPEDVAAPPADAAPPSSLTGTGAVMGTPAYMAPEQCLGRAATPATDQFAFCVTLFEALAGVRPFAGATFDALAAAKIGGDRRPWPEGSRVPAPVRAAVDRGLAALPENRHESMDVLLAQLERESGTSRARGHWSRIAIPVVVGAIGIGALAIVATRRAGEARAPAAPTAAAACVVGASALTSIWNDAKKTEVRARLAENAATPIAVDEAIATIDGQARAWAEMHDVSCATTREGTQSEAVFRLRAACLRRRWNELVETIDVLAVGKLDPDDAFRGDPLGSVRACADVRTLGAGDPLPDDPGERAEIEDLYARVARIRAMSGGRWVSLDGLGERAAKLRWAPALAEQALLGAELSAGPKMEDAIVAANASRDDELVARARRAYARKRASSGPALEDLSIALAAAARLERPDLRADVLEQRAGTEQQLGLFAASLATAKEALSLREAGADTPGRSRASWTIDLALVRAESALEVDDLPAARAALAVLLPVQEDAVRAQRLVLGARIAIAEGQPFAALAPLVEARRLATATRERVDLMKSKSRELRSRRLAQHAFYGALGATAAAEIALGRAADAQRDLVEMLTLLTTNGFRIEPFLEVRAIVALTRLVRGRVPAARVLVQANHAFEIVKMLDPAPIVVEALVGLGEALTAAGDPNAAIARLTHAELLARDGSLRLRVECASALLSAARARGADPAARPRAEEIARRVLQETKPDTPGHDAFAKLVASERSE